MSKKPSAKRNAQLPKTPAAPARPPRSAPEITQLGPDDRAARVQYLVREGAHLLAAKRPGEATELLIEAWELDPQDTAAAINLGGAYILQGKHERAIAPLETATRLEPDNPMAWMNLAAAYLGKLPFATRERQDQAIAAFERAAALNPRTPHVHYNLGLIYLERDEPERAADCFRDALDTDPSDRDAQHWLDQIGRGAGTPRGPQE
jgi:tetratricopeptide (TPR) repeat protein